VVRFVVVGNIVYQYCFHTFRPFIKTISSGWAIANSSQTPIFPQLKYLLKTLHLLVKRHKYKDLILVSLIIVALYK
jgi:hypothetical protein